MPRARRTGSSARPSGGRAASAGRSVVVVVEGYPYPSALEALLAAEGHTLERVSDLGEAASLLTAGRARAVLIGARAFSHRDLLAFRLCRTVAPATALVVVTTEPPPAWPDLKRALESGATAFLRWPAARDVVRQALRSGASGVAPAHSETR